ncbi:hypothetical protein Pint_34228 [Pistacia integerrima]|uniref:Uncharacterized protein n=1 Tax=Pistacia integerrima TaxID=434235 RepID=A0ACC0X9C7_9ROSI|nr:hypothetical protein Pint_34228 [Pistacia integerrima]
MGLNLRLMTLLLFTSHHSRDRAFKISAIAHFHRGSRPFETKEVIHRCSPKLWFVKVVFMLLVRSHLCLDSCLGYFDITYYLLLRALCESGLHDVAKVVFDYMRSDGHLPNSSIIDFLVLSFTEVGKLDLVKELLSQLPSEKIAMDSFTCNSLLNLLVKQNKVNEDIFLFKEHFRFDTWTLNIMIRGLCRIGEVNKAFEIFCNMESWNFIPMMCIVALD